MDTTPIMKRKLELYEEFFRRMKEIDNDELKVFDEGEYIVVDELKDLRELGQKEQRAIKEQDNLHNYVGTMTHVNKANSVYGMCKWFIGGFVKVPFL